MKNLNSIVIGIPLLLGGKIGVKAATFCAEAQAQGAVWSVLPAVTIEQARNLMVSFVLQELPLATHIFFLNEDTVPPKDIIGRLLEHDKDIIAAAVPYEQGWGKIKWGAGIQKKSIDCDKLPDCLFKADWVTASAVLIKREVFEKMTPPYYRTIYTPKGMVRCASDAFFSEKAKAVGFDLWVDPSVKCGGNATVNLLDYISLASVRGKQLKKAVCKNN